MSGSVRVEGVARLEHGQALCFRFDRKGERFEAFLLKYEGELYAYVNRCPHWQVDLDMGFGDFYDAGDDRIFCRTHGAMFQPKSGYCDSGPCTGDALERLVVEREDEDRVIVIF